MARYTLDQLLAMQAPEKAWEAAGYTKAGWQDDDGQDMWYGGDDGEGSQQLRSTSQLMNMMENGDFESGANLLPDNIIPWNLQDTSTPAWFNQRYGTNFNDYKDYLNYLYGPGGEFIERGPAGNEFNRANDTDYYILPEGKTAADYVNAPLRYDSPDSGLGKWMPAILGGVALAGLGGLLPGTTSIFGGGAGGFVGGASGAGVTGAAGGAGVSGATSAGLIGGAGASLAGAAPLYGTAALGTGGITGLGAEFGTAALGSTASSLGASGAAAAGAAGGGSFLDSIIGGLKDATKGITTKDLLSGGLNYFLNQKTADDMAAAAGAAGQMGDPLAHPTRQPYQQMLMQLMQNPQSFYETNPVVASQLDQARKQFLANSAKMGVGGTQTAKYFDNMKNVFAGTFNDQANLLSGLGGFGFPGGGGTNAYMQGMTGAAQQGAESYRGLGDIASKIFGNTSFGNKSVSDIFGLG